jgi:hypothetical protein
MASRLTNIQVRRVSFVKRAAVRDPADQSQPRRFILYKADTSTEKDGVAQMARTTTNDGDLNVSSDAQAAIHGAVALLAPHSISEPRIAALCNKLTSIAAPVGQGDEAVSKSLRSLAELRKTEGLPDSTRQRVDKSSRSLQLEVLRKQNPRAAVDYEIAHRLRPPLRPGETLDSVPAAA